MAAYNYNPAAATIPAATANTTFPSHIWQEGQGNTGNEFLESIFIPQRSVPAATEGGVSTAGRPSSSRSRSGRGKMPAASKGIAGNSAIGQVQMSVTLPNQQNFSYSNFKDKRI